MNAEQFREWLESRGYKVKSVRVFKKSFHVAYSDDEAKYVRYCGFSIESIPPKFDGGRLWLSLYSQYPRVGGEG